MFEKFYKHIIEPEKYGSICAAINCRRDKNVKPRGFFSFPSTEERCKQWVIRCRRLDLYGVPPYLLNKYYSLCKKHFDLTDFKGDISKITNGDDLPYPTLFDFPFIRYSVPLQDPVSKNIKVKDLERKIFPGGVNFKSINRVVIMGDDKLFLCGGPLLQPKNMFCCPETKILLYSPKEMFLLETSYYCLALVGVIKMTDQNFGHLEAIGLFNICEAFVTYRTVVQMVNDNSWTPVNFEKIEGVHREFIGDIRCKYMGKDSIKNAQETGNIIRKLLENHKYRRRTIPTILNKNKVTTQSSAIKKLYLNPSNNNLPGTSSAVHHVEEPTSNKPKLCEQSINVSDKVVNRLKKIADPHQVNGVSQFAVLIDPSKKGCKDQVTLAPMEFFKLPKLNLFQDDDESRRKLYQIDLSKTCSKDALAHSHTTGTNYGLQLSENTLSQSKNVEPQTNSVSNSNNRGPESKEGEHQLKNVLYKSNYGYSRKETILPHDLPHSNSTVSQSKCHVTQANCGMKQVADTLSQSKNVVHQTNSETHSKNCVSESKERVHKHLNVLYKSNDGDLNSEDKFSHLSSSSTVSQSNSHITQANCGTKEVSNTSSQSKNVVDQTNSVTTESKERKRRRKSVLHKSNDSDSHSEIELLYPWQHSKSPVSQTGEGSAQSSYCLLFNDSINCFDKTLTVEEEDSNNLSDTEVLASEYNRFGLFAEPSSILNWTNQPLTYGKTGYSKSQSVDTFKNKCFKKNDEFSKQLKDTACSYEQISFSSKETIKSTIQIPQMVDSLDLIDSADLTSIEDIHFKPTTEIVKHEPVIFKYPLYRIGNVVESQNESECDEGLASEEDDLPPVEVVKVPYIKSTRHEKFMLLSQENKSSRSNCSTYDSDKEIISDDENNTYKRSRLMTLNGLYKDIISRVPITNKLKSTLKDVFAQNCNREASQIKAKRSLIKIPVGNKKTVPITKEHISNLLTQALVLPSLHGIDYDKTVSETEDPQQDSMVVGNEIVIDQESSHEQELSMETIPNNQPESNQEHLKKHSDQNSNDLSHNSIQLDKTSSNQKSILKSLAVPIHRSPKEPNKRRSDNFNDIMNNKPLPHYIKSVIKDIFPTEKVIVHKLSASDKISSADLSQDIFNKPSFDLSPKEVILSSNLSLKFSTVPVDHEGIPQHVKDIMSRSNKKVCRLLRISEFHPSKKKIESVKRITDSIDYDARQQISCIKPQLQVEVNSDCGLVPHFGPNENIIKSFTSDVEQQCRSCVPEPVSLIEETDCNSVSVIKTKASASIVPNNPSPLMRTYQKRHSSLASFIENFSSEISDAPINTDDFTPPRDDNNQKSSGSSSNDLSTSRTVHPKIISIGSNLKPQIETIDFKSNYMPKTGGLGSKFDMILPPPAPVERSNNSGSALPTLTLQTIKINPHKCQCGGGVPIPSDLSWYLTKTRFDKVPEPYKKLAKQFLELKLENNKLKKRYFRCKNEKEKIKKRHRPIKLKDLIIEVKKYLSPEAYEFLKSSITLKKYKSQGFRYSDELKRICCKLVLSGGWKSYLYLASFFALPNRRTILRFIYQQIDVIRSAKQIQDAVDSIGLPSTSTGYRDTTVDAETSLAVQSLVPDHDNPSALQNLKHTEIIPPDGVNQDALEPSVVKNLEDAKTELFHANDILSFGCIENILKAEGGPSNLRGLVPPPRVRARKKLRERSKSPKKRKMTKKSDIETELSHDESGVRVHRNSSQNKKRKKVKQSPSRTSMPELNRDRFHQTDEVALDNASERNFQDVFNDWMNNLTMATDQDEAGPSGSKLARRQQNSVRSRKSSSPTKLKYSSGGKTKRNYEHHNYYTNPEEVAYYNSPSDVEQCYEEVVHSTNYEDSHDETSVDSS